MVVLEDVSLSQMLVFIIPEKSTARVEKDLFRCVLQFHVTEHRPWCLSLDLDEGVGRYIKVVSSVGYFAAFSFG